MPPLPFPDIDPVLVSFRVFGLELAIRWYALAYIAGLLLGWRYVAALMRRPALWGGTAPMRPKQTEDLLTWMILGVILGGRIGYVLFYQPGYYAAHPAEILAVWRGGMSFHGGFLGVFAGVLGFSWRNGLDWRHWTNWLHRCHWTDRLYRRHWCHRVHRCHGSDWIHWCHRCHRVDRRYGCHGCYGHHWRYWRHWSYRRNRSDWRHWSHWWHRC